MTVHFSHTSYHASIIFFRNQERMYFEIITPVLAVFFTKVLHNKSVVNICCCGVCDYAALAEIAYIIFSFKRCD